MAWLCLFHSCQFTMDSWFSSPPGADVLRQRITALPAGSPDRPVLENACRGAVEAAMSDSVRRRFERHGGYELVAWVDGTDPEDAWRLTQNGVSSVSWSRLPPPRVHPVGDGVGDGVVAVPVGGRFGRRSSDMGDVVMGEGGGIWRVAMFGFVSLEPCSVPEVPAPVRRETDPGGKRLHWTMELLCGNLRTSGWMARYSSRNLS